jgi:hypothetical protein
MAQYCIKGKRIRNVCIPKEYDINKIQIGIPVKSETQYYLREHLALRVEKMHMDMFMQINLSLKSVDMYQQTGFILLGMQMLLR